MNANTVPARAMQFVNQDVLPPWRISWVTLRLALWQSGLPTIEPLS